MGKECSQESMEREGAVLGWLVVNQGECPFLPGSLPGALLLAVATSVLDSGDLAVVPDQMNVTLVNVTDCFHL